MLPELLAYRSYTAVTQVINIINLRFHILEADNLFHNRYNIFFGEILNVNIVQFQAFVQSVAAHFTKVIFLVAEEQTLKNGTCRFRIRHIAGTNLLVNFCKCRIFIISRIFTERIHHHVPFGFLSCNFLNQYFFALGFFK